MLKEAYCNNLAGRFGYPKTSMNPPPSEVGENVLQFSLTEGCTHNACTFCDMYKGTSYVQRGIKEFAEHVVQVVRHLYEKNQLHTINRLFIGGGNSLAVDTETLLHATQLSLYTG